MALPLARYQLGFINDVFHHISWESIPNCPVSSWAMNEFLPSHIIPIRYFRSKVVKKQKSKLGWNYFGMEGTIRRNQKWLWHFLLSPFSPYLSSLNPQRTIIYQFSRNQSQHQHSSHSWEVNWAWTFYFPGGGREQCGGGEGREGRERDALMPSSGNTERSFNLIKAIRSKKRPDLPYVEHPLQFGNDVHCGTKFERFFF